MRQVLLYYTRIKISAKSAAFFFLNKSVPDDKYSNSQDVTQEEEKKKKERKKHEKIEVMVMSIYTVFCLTWSLSALCSIYIV